jgi:LPXTG-motif cell wall-anchored protein
MDLDVGDSKFFLTVYDVTDRNDMSSIESNLFFINANNGTSTADSNASTVTPEDSQEITASTGLATGAKAGIGAGIGVLALVLLLAGFFLYRRKKRQTPSIDPTDGFEKPELDAKSNTIAEVDGSGISPHQAPDSAIYEAPGVLVHEAPTGGEKTVIEKREAARQINQEPIEMPADSPMSSPKTSQDRLPVGSSRGGAN